MGLRTVFENNCSTSNTTLASYNVTALGIIKADALLQSGFKTSPFRRYCCSLVSKLVTIAFSVL